MKKYLWIGNYEDATRVTEMAKKGYKSSSSQVSQQNLILGLEQTKDCIFDIISGSVLPCIRTTNNYLFIPILGVISRGLMTLVLVILMVSILTGFHVSAPWK